MSATFSAEAPLLRTRVEHSVLTRPVPSARRVEPRTAAASIEPDQGERSFAWRWPVMACVVVALLGPTLAIAASRQWGALVAAGIVLLEGAALVLITALAVRQREAWFRDRVRKLRIEPTHGEDASG